MLNQSNICAYSIHLKGNLVVFIQDCYTVYQAVENIPYLLETLESHTGPNKSLLMELFNPAKVCYHNQTI